MGSARPLSNGVHCKYNEGETKENGIVEKRTNITV